MKNKITRKHLNLDSWPLFLMSSAQASKDAMVGGLWDVWFQTLKNVYSTEKRLKKMTLDKFF
eukprot:UN03425